MRASAQSRAAEIETQHRNAQRVHGFRGVVNDLVVHRPAKQRMWMANQRCQRRQIGARWRPENRLQTAGRSYEKEILRVVSDAHLQKLLSEQCTRKASRLN